MTAEADQILPISSWITHRYLYLACTPCERSAITIRVNTAHRGRSRRADHRGEIRPLREAIGRKVASRRQLVPVLWGRRGKALTRAIHLIGPLCWAWRCQEPPSAFSHDAPYVGYSSSVFRRVKEALDADCQPPYVPGCSPD